MARYANFTFKTEAPLELFGFHPDDPRLSVQRQSRLCPFTGTKCIKQLYRTDKPPSGCCSVAHGGKRIIICPNRFHENDKEILVDAAKRVLGKNQLHLVGEVQLPGGFGRVDWVATELDDKGRLLDFVPIETHANQTTSTGGLTDAVEEHESSGKLSQNKYKFGLNTYHQIKTFFTQCLQKSQLFKKWNRKFIWVLDESLFDNWINRFNLALNPLRAEDEIFFFSYGLDFDDDKGKYKLVLRNSVSTDRATLVQVYNRPSADLPDEGDFIETIKHRLNQQNQ